LDKANVAHLFSGIFEKKYVRVFISVN